MSGKSRRPSASMVVALLALFVALSGASYAALKKNTVGPKQIVKNGVGASEIAGDAVRAKEIKDGKVGSAELGDDAVTRSELQDNAVGSGEVEDGTLNGGDVQDESLGSAEVAGLVGGDITSGTFLGGNVRVQFEQAPAALADNTSTSYDVHCPEGQTALGGGSRGDATDSEFTITTSSRPIISTTSPGAPVDDGTFTGWRATVLNPTGGAADPPPQTAAAPPGGAILPEVWVVCASVP
jgi:hypothetical protein